MMVKGRVLARLQSLLLLAFAAAVAGSAVQSARADGDAARGAYLARIMDCGGCHTPGALRGQPDEGEALGGSDIGFAVPAFGVFYPPNLTPHPETGLGAWSEADIVRAVREGVRPDGRGLAPAMPWRSYAVLSDADAADLAAYLKSLPQVDRRVPGPFGPTESLTTPYLSLVVPPSN